MRLIVPLVLLLASLPPAALAAGVCLPSCGVAAHFAGYASPVTVATSGATVTWSSLDIQHTATAQDFCFNVGFGVSPGSASVRIDAGQLFVKVGATEHKCAGAAALPDGTTLVPYSCLYHVNMRAVLVVTPGVTA